MKKIFLFVSSLLIASLLTFLSCEKPKDIAGEEDNIPAAYDTTETIPAKNITEIMTGATVAYLDAVGMVINKGDSEDDAKTCPTVAYEPTVGYPKTLTLDFGTGCTYNGRDYNGKIIATVSGRIRDAGTSISIVFDNFKADTIELSGTITITIDSSKVLTDHIAYFTVTLSDGSITIPSGTYSMNMNISVKWDLDTLTDYTDDVLYIHKGFLTGEDSNNSNYYLTITQQLEYAVSCGNISKGEIEIETPKFDNGATVDFGNGTCDNTAIVHTVAVVTIGNQTYTKDVEYELILP